MNAIPRQIQEIKEGGLSVFSRKVRTLVRHAPHWTIAFLRDLPAVLAARFVRLLRPLVTIRFGTLRPGRIAHFIDEPEVYLAECALGIHGKRVINIFYYDENNQPDEGGRVSNQQVRAMLERVLPVSDFARRIVKVNRRRPGWESYEIPWRFHHVRDIHGALHKTKPRLAFTREEEQAGRAALRAFGVPDGAPFVCFHARDAAYLKQLLPGYDASYHDYRDCSIQHFVPAVEELAKRGYYAFRMGAVVQDVMVTACKNVIDYANKGRTDFLDIYLGATCSFFIGSGSGIDGVPMAFRRPIAYTNILPVGFLHSWDPNHISLPKKLWLRAEKRFMTFPEIMKSEVRNAARLDVYTRNGIDVVENTPEEVTALALEMDERLRGVWKPQDDDEELQRRFWSLYERGEYHGAFVSRIGAAFLRENRSLLDGVA